jgi:cysteinyl-tRNA synthetase
MKIYNSLTRQKEDFIPIDPNEIKIYACGPTVYNYIHIGNARPLIVFDTLRRYLKYLGYQVKFVQNFTDIDDKMINRANQEGITVKELADEYIAQYNIDARGLNVMEADIHPKATENIDAIIEIVSKLIDKGYAYESKGDVYFSAKADKEYGKLSHQPLEDLEAGARIDISEQKRDPMDFALWKAQKPGEPAWDSPWGKGRPGWHIECSAMANRYLGTTIDIHGGGQDLLFPHHENEVAQSECANGAPLARYWMHNGYINVDNRKMSKSLNNFFTVREVSQEFDYEVIRFFMLSAQYRSPVNFSKELMEQAKNALDRLYNCLLSLKFMAENTEISQATEEEKKQFESISALENEFKAAMDDDLNTANAIAVLFDMVKAINTAFSENEAHSKEVLERCSALLKKLGDVLGILNKDLAVNSDTEIEQLIEERQAARKQKDWAKADAIRDQLAAMDIILEDTPLGVKWKRK